MAPPHAPPPRNEMNEAEWRKFLEQPDVMMGFGRRVFSHMPSNPRCQLCASPFAGGEGALMRAIGKEQSTGNPLMCTSCEKQLLKRRGGAEVESSLLFADVRGSTQLGEQLSSSDYRALLARYYTVASEAVSRTAASWTSSSVTSGRWVAPFLAERRTPSARSRPARADHARTGHGDRTDRGCRSARRPRRARMWFGTVEKGSHVEIDRPRTSSTRCGRGGGRRWRDRVRRRTARGRGTSTRTSSNAASI